jgi:hypothetical protein
MSLQRQKDRDSLIWPRSPIQFWACDPLAKVFASESSIFDALSGFLIKFCVSVKSQAA